MAKLSSPRWSWISLEILGLSSSKLGSFTSLACWIHANLQQWVC